MFYWNNYHLSHTHTHTQTWEGENRKQKRLGKCKIQWFNPQIKNVVWSINWCGVCVFIFFFPFVHVWKLKNLFCYFNNNNNNHLGCFNMRTWWTQSTATTGKGEERGNLHVLLVGTETGTVTLGKFGSTQQSWTCVWPVTQHFHSCVSWLYFWMCTLRMLIAALLQYYKCLE